MKTRLCGTKSLIIAGWVSAISPGPAQADTLAWVNPKGGKFSEATNWEDPTHNPRVPTAADEALFAISGPFTVSFSRSTTAAATIRNLSSPTFDLSGGDFSVTDLLTIDGASLTVSAGKLTAGGVRPGELRLINGALVEIGRPWETSLNVGISISDGGALETKGGASGGSLTVANPGSRFSANGVLDMRSLILTDGALVTNVTEATLGAALINSKAMLRGGGSLVVGRGIGPKPDGFMRIESGGSVSSVTAIISQFPAIDNPLGQVVVSGADSTWIIQSSLQVGLADGNQANLQVADQGAVLSGPIDIAVTERSGATVQVMSNASLSSTGPIRIGVGGSGRLSIRDNGRVHMRGANRLELGIEATGGGVVGLSGSSSQLNIEGASLDVGVLGDGRFSIDGGATFLSGPVRVGNESTSTDRDGAQFFPASNNISVSGEGSTWTVGGPVTLGLGGKGSGTVASGAQLSSTAGWLGVLAGSGGEIVINGLAPNADRTIETVWTVDQDVIVGDAGAGKLTIHNGGTVKLTGPSGLSVGKAGATGTLLVTSPDSRLGCKTLLIGGGNQGGGIGSVTLAGGTAATVEQKLFIGHGCFINVIDGATTVGATAPQGTRGTVQINSGGVLAGYGTVVGQKVKNGGTVSPGGSIGTLTIEGDYEETPAGILEIEIAGLDGGVQYDILKVTGNVSLAGKLLLRFINGFAPAKGQMFEFLRSGPDIVGKFDQMEVIGLAPGFQYDLKPTADGNYALTALNDGVATSSPALSIIRNSTGILVSWPAASQGFILQSAADLLDSSRWTDLSTSLNQLSIDIKTPQQFFRLIKP